MLVKGSSSSRVRINASEENARAPDAAANAALAKTNVEPEEFDSSESHQSLLMEGMNQLRLKNHLLDVKLKAQGRTFKVRLYFNMLLLLNHPNLFPIRRCCQRGDICL